jgi:hypothetical protein
MLKEVETAGSLAQSTTHSLVTCEWATKTERKKKPELPKKVDFRRK